MMLWKTIGYTACIMFHHLKKSDISSLYSRTPKSASFVMATECGDCIQKDAKWASLKEFCSQLDVTDEPKSDPNILDTDVIGIAESRLISTDENEDFYVPGFEPPVRLDQKQNNFNTRPPHGLVLYYRTDCFLHNTFTYSTPHLEFVKADIISSSKGLFQVVFVYKAPHCKFTQLKDVFLADLLPDVYLRHPKIIIMGDFNFDLNTGNTSFFKFMRDTFCCSQIVSKPTTSYGTVLDLIFLNFDSRVNFETDVLDSYWSDHNVIYVAIETQ
ncbi:unnamed protein product [Mytilus coruscus]|uniref:Endonuclease/exonuclease/phosphatase domain-containing protein n=1 Tax=Mytilus coruscus TaxID=42192 RepID=A0A6J8DUC6_MYTCO|nr:unnamed protein product [Mytilus coruscus]